MALAALAAIVLLILFASAGPLATDDLWWHLSLGRLYAESGPWLDHDPRLHTAEGPPHPNAWLFDVLVALIADHGGFPALRAFHAGTLALILALVWRALRRAADSSAAASLGTAAFVAMSAYRLLQLRPSLMTILACILLYLLVLEPRSPPSGRRIAGAGLLCALWSNLHPGFLLGPVLLATAAVSAALGSLIPAFVPAETPKRALRLGLAAALALAATGVNPDAFSAHATYLGAGAEAAVSAFVVDEWRPLQPFSLPLLNLPPTPAAWLWSWGLLLVTPIVIARALARAVRADTERESESRLDPVALALAAIGLLAPFVAVRFLWLSIFPLMLLARAARRPLQASARASWAVALACLLLLPIMLRASAWTLLAPRAKNLSYSSDYHADRYFAHGIWFLADSGVEGRLFQPYFMGGFAEFWLSPGLQTFVDGSLNFPPDVLDDYAQIQQLEESPSGPGLGERLDRHGVDFFVGVGVPFRPPPGRPWRYTTSHLQRNPDWLLVYRGLRSAIYMRRAPRNDQNLARIERYYRAAGVPFDRESGLDVARLLEENVAWAIEHGVAPIDHPRLVEAASNAPPRKRRIARERLATALAVLGLYEAGLAVDGEARRPRTTLSPGRARERRRIWSLIQLDRGAEAVAEIDALLAQHPDDRILLSLANAARRFAAAEDPDERHRIAAMMTPMTRIEGGRIKSVERPAPARSTREATPESP